MKHNWEYKRLGDVCEKASSNLAQKELDLKDEGYPIFGASGQIGYLDFYQRAKPYIGIVKDGSVGRTQLYPAKSSLLGTLQYIIPNQKVSTNYLCYAIKSLNLSRYVKGAAIPHIYFRDYKNEIVPVPPMEVQERIVVELDDINAMIEAKREQLKQLDMLAQSVFYNMFGDPVTNPKGWEVKKLGDLCEVSSAKRVLVQDVVEIGIPFIRGTELALLSKQTTYDPDVFTMFITPEHYEKVKAITGVPARDDLLIPSINSEGYVWAVNTDSPITSVS